MLKLKEKLFYRKIIISLPLVILVGLNGALANAAECKVKPSSCAYMDELGVVLDINKGNDFCKKSTPLGLIKTHTGPAGEYVFPHPSIHGWQLLKDYNQRRDYWKSKECK